MKKIISFIMAVCLIFGISISAFAEINLGAYDNNDVVDFENYTRNLEKEKNMRNNPISRTATPSVSITRYPQIVSYYCGPASAYMVLKSLGKSVTSSSATLCFFDGCPDSCPYPGVNHTCRKQYTDPQITLANAMGTNYSGTGFAVLKNTINSYLGTSYYALCTIENTSAGTTNLVNKASSTLEDDHPLIAHVYAKRLNRYSGSAGQTFRGHYICIYSVNVNTSNFGISDCNYYSGLGGTYGETGDTLRNAIAYYSSNNLMW